MDYDVPEAEDLVPALDVLESRLARQGQYDQAVDVGSAIKRMRLDSDEITRLRARIAELERADKWTLMAGLGDGVTISREWCMPSRWTFQMRPVASLLERFLTPGLVSVDPFSGQSTWATHRNDMASDTPAQTHLDALDFCAKLADESADVALFDPPYSNRQLAESYKSVGRPYDGMNARYFSAVKDQLTRVLRPGGIAISFGWNSTGFGAVRGFDRVETLLVCHGGAHNDTIVSVEVKG